MKWLVYTGPHLEVEVPHDEVTGGLIEATRGKAVEVPDPIAESLLSQGEDQVSDSDDRAPQHDHTWRTATSKEISAAQKTEPDAAQPNAAVSEETPKEGDK